MSLKFTKKGFTLLYSVLVVGALMSLVFATLNISFKQAQLSNINRNSSVAYYAADGGLECARYWSDYGAFNVGNPVTSMANPSLFSSIECLHNVITNCSGGQGTTCGLVGAQYSASASPDPNLGNPIIAANLRNTGPNGMNFSNNFYSYSLTTPYANAGSSLAPQVKVNIWQNQELPSDLVANPADLTTAILSTGANTSNAQDPRQVQRGVGHEAAVSQCLAPAFWPASWSSQRYWTSATANFGATPSDGSLGLATLLTPFFPGIAYSTIANAGSAVRFVKPAPISDAQSANAIFWYILENARGAQLPDFWTFNPAGGTLPLVVSAAPLKIPQDTGITYIFGYYTDDPANVQEIMTIDNGDVTNTKTVQIPAGTGVHFVLKANRDSDGSPVFFVSTNVNDDAYNGVIPDGDAVPYDTMPHLIVISVPMPGNIDNSNGNTGNHHAGQYIFAFDDSQQDLANQADPSHVYFDGIVIKLQLAGCP